MTTACLTIVGDSVSVDWMGFSQQLEAARSQNTINLEFT